MQNLQPTDNANFLRDIDTNALINTNVAELQSLKARRDKIVQREKQRTAEVEDLKKQIEELKQLIQIAVGSN
jgi:uncharacterized protein involved in exopolysaccharide biosynthesis